MNEPGEKDRHLSKKRTRGTSCGNRPMQKPPDKKAIFLCVAALALITLVTFSPAFTAGYIIWDDESAVVNNEIIKELTLDNVKKMFTGSEKEGIYIPLSYLSYAIEIAIFGKDPTTVFHAVNVLLHLGNTILVLFFCYRLTKSLSVSFITAALFAVHPMHVESVAWVTGRKDVLSTFFMLAALIFYLEHLANNRRIHYVFSLLGFVLAAMAKPTVITVPVLLILFDYFTGKRFLSRRRLLEKVPFFCISIFITILTIFLHIREKGISEKQALEVGTNLMVAIDNVVFYLGKLIAPVKISLFRQGR